MRSESGAAAEAERRKAEGELRMLTASKLTDLASLQAAVRRAEAAGVAPSEMAPSRSASSRWKRRRR